MSGTPVDQSLVRGTPSASASTPGASATGSIDGRPAEQAAPGASPLSAPQIPKDFPNKTLSNRAVSVIIEEGKKANRLETFKVWRSTKGLHWYEAKCGVLIRKAAEGIKQQKAELELASSAGTQSTSAAGGAGVAEAGGSERDKEKDFNEAILEIARGAIGGTPSQFKACLEVMKEANADTFAKFKESLKSAIGEEFGLFKEDVLPKGVNAENFYENVFRAKEFLGEEAVVEPKILNTLSAAKAMVGIANSRGKSNVTLGDTLRLCAKYPEHGKQLCALAQEHSLPLTKGLVQLCAGAETDGKCEQYLNAAKELRDAGGSLFVPSAELVKSCVDDENKLPQYANAVRELRDAGGSLFVPSAELVQSCVDDGSKLSQYTNALRELKDAIGGHLCPSADLVQLCVGADSSSKVQQYIDALKALKDAGGTFFYPSAELVKSYCDANEDKRKQYLDAPRELKDAGGDHFDPSAELVKSYCDANEGKRKQYIDALRELKDAGGDHFDPPIELVQLCVGVDGSSKVQQYTAAVKALKQVGDEDFVPSAELVQLCGDSKECLAAAKALLKAEKYGSLLTKNLIESCANDGNKLKRCIAAAKKLNAAAKAAEKRSFIPSAELVKLCASDKKYLDMAVALLNIKGSESFLAAELVQLCGNDPEILAELREHVKRGNHIIALEMLSGLVDASLSDVLATDQQAVAPEAAVQATSTELPATNVLDEWW
jgi:hypothetical protein